MGMHMGDFKDGKPYHMEPDEYGQVTARCNATVFKPYIGIGYNGCPTSNKRLRIGFDADVPDTTGVSALRQGYESAAQYQFQNLLHTILSMK